MTTIDEALVWSDMMAVIKKHNLQGSQEYYQLICEITTLHAKKNADYAAQNIHGGMDNFIQTASDCGISPRSVFKVMQSIKLSRYNGLTHTGRIPNNESIKDTVQDMAVYRLLEAAFEARYGSLIDQPLASWPGYTNSDNSPTFFPVLDETA